MSRRWPYIALFGAGLCWGFGLPFGKIALRETDAAHMILLRFLVAAAACAPFVLARREGRRLLLKPSLIASGVFYALGFLAQFEGLARADVSVAALLVGAAPALIAVSAVIVGERVGPAAWAGIAAACLGAVLIAGKPGPGTTLSGVLLCLGSLPPFIGWLYATRAAGRHGGPVQVAWSSILVSAVFLAIVVTALHGPPSFALSPAAWGGIVGQGLFSTVLATLCWQLGAPRVSTAAAGVFINVEPVVGAALGMALFHERLAWPALAGGVAILLGSLTVVLFEHRAAGARTAAEDAPTPA
jgi:drug/metabolite transporter (DMT)-like permease